MPQTSFSIEWIPSFKKEVGFAARPLGTCYITIVGEARKLSEITGGLQTIDRFGSSCEWEVSAVGSVDAGIQCNADYLGVERR